jgi:hypothetical protein
MTKTTTRFRGRGMPVRAPGGLARWALLRATQRGARAEARAERPFVRRDPAGGDVAAPPPYQQHVRRTLHTWIDDFARRAVPLLHALRADVHEQGKLARALAVRRDEARRFVHDPLKLGGEGNAMVLALLLASMVNFAITYDIVEERGWPLPITLVATLAIVLLEVAVTALVGWGIGALVFDRPDSPHDLEPRERTEVLVRTIILGVAVVVFVGVLGVQRGSVLWALVAFLGAAIGAYLVAAACESRFHRAHRKLANETRAAEHGETVLREHYLGTQRQIWERGEWLCDEARRILAHGDDVPAGVPSAPPQGPRAASGDAGA